MTERLGVLACLPPRFPEGGYRHRVLADMSPPSLLDLQDRQERFLGISTVPTCFIRLFPPSASPGASASA